MKVLLVGNYAIDDQKSMKAFALMLERELTRLGCRVELLVPEPVLVPSKNVPTGLWKWTAYVDKFIVFPLRLARKARNFDIVHVCDHSNAMYWPFVRSRPNLITCHDVIAMQAGRGEIPGWKVSSTGKLFQRLIAAGLVQFQKIACVSDLTRRDLCTMLQPRGQVSVIHNGLNAPFRPVPGTPSHLVDGMENFPGYFLHVGSGLPRKNRSGVVRIYRELLNIARSKDKDVEFPALLFVGPSAEPELAAEIDCPDLAGRLFFKENATHEELCSAYSGAKALLFPSFQEGFGWPIIEAQACGCPVFTSDLPPMNEIGGAAAVYISPDDPRAAATTISSHLVNLSDMRTRGLENAKQFTAELMAEAYFQQYGNCIEAFERTK